MKKYEYLSELEKRLSALPADARRDALNYYEEYFDAAGPRQRGRHRRRAGRPCRSRPQDSGRGGADAGRRPCRTRERTRRCCAARCPGAARRRPTARPAPKARSRGKNHVADFRRCHCCGAAHSAGRPCAEFCKARRRHGVDGCCADGGRNCCIRSCPQRGLLQRDRRHRGRGQRQPHWRRWISPPVWPTPKI